jgi:monofunctional glycosyltransferase
MSQTIPGPSSRTWIRRIRKAVPVVLKVLGAVAAAILLAIAAYRFVAPPVSALMVWRLVQGYGMDYRWVPLEDMSAALPAAVIASEDGRFCVHGGVDWTALGTVFEALTDNPDAAPRGASTIAMQTAKNLFLWPSRSYLRKAPKLPLAAWSIWCGPSARVIEIYLNVAEWGPAFTAPKPPRVTISASRRARSRPRRRPSWRRCCPTRWRAAPASRARSPGGWPPRCGHACARSTSIWGASVRAGSRTVFPGRCAARSDALQNRGPLQQGRSAVPALRGSVARCSASGKHDMPQPGRRRWANRRNSMRLKMKTMMKVRQR